jgi:hypothetical protein
MGAEVVVGKSYRFLMPQEVFRKRQSHNITVILPAYNEEVSIGSVVLLTRLYADREIVVDNGSSGEKTEIVASVGVGNCEFSK